MKILVALLVLFLAACNKEENTFTDTYFTNATQHTIKVTVFMGAATVQSMSFGLGPNEKKKVYYNNTRGLGRGVSYGYINSPMDSIVVAFDTTHTITHYKANLIGSNPKHYLYESDRNIYNDKSYAMTVTKSTDTQKSVEFLYTFTEQDYLDAQ